MTPEEAVWWFAAIAIAGGVALLAFGLTAMIRAHILRRDIQRRIDAFDQVAPAVEVPERAMPDYSTRKTRAPVRRPLQPVRAVCAAGVAGGSRDACVGRAGGRERGNGGRHGA